MSKMSLLLFLVVGVFSFFDLGQAARIPRHLTEPEESTCGYKSCPAVDPNKLNIHLVAHTHDDVGWLKTVDQYYFGSRSMIQKAGVQYILDSVIQALKNHPDRKFIYVETAFLWKWWLRQNEQVRNDVRQLIDEGRLEIIGGAWSMNDEATTHYHSIIDQFTWGLRRLNDTFGDCGRPRVGWQIDPFGHSREQASLFAQMGYDGMLFGRLDYQDKTQRLKDKTMEFIWKSSPSLGDRANLFTTAMYNTYSPPPGFCFDVLCADEPIIDDPDSPDNNVAEKIDAFLKYASKQSQYYRTNNVILTMGGDFTYQQADMYYTNLDKIIRLFLAYAEILSRSYATNNIIVTMGDDFNYQDANMWFTNLDKIIRYGNERNGDTVNLFYSTPSCYLKALHDTNRVWPTKSDDFFPYASDPHAYWTGYFSSRPTQKFFERMGNNILQISKQLSALTDLKGFESQLEHFRESMGMMQHHDAVTGTEKQAVANDYARILYESIHNGEKMIAEALRKWTKKSHVSVEQLDKVGLHTCLEMNISSCVYTEQNDNFIVTLYNPLSRPLTTYVRLPVSGEGYDVYDFAVVNHIPSQVVPIPTAVLRIPGRTSSATNELVFRAVDIPALGFKHYAVKRLPPNIPHVENIDSEPEPSSISNDFYDITANEPGRITVQYKKEKNMNFVQAFHYYEGAEGNNRVFKNRSSGAYIFRPKQAHFFNFTQSQLHRIIKGPLVEEIHQQVNEWISQVVRIYKGEDRVEFDWLVGPIPVENKVGKEIVSTYSSNLNSDGVFYTDSNGREMLKRVRNYRPTWELDLHEPISGNYYPVTSKISLKNQIQSLKFSVLTDRSQGGTSMKDGELELMLHRRLLNDDAFGVGEALNESAFGEGLVVRGTHYVIGGNAKNLDAIALKEKESALELALRPLVLITPVNDDIPPPASPDPGLSGLAKQLPANVHILTLEPWKDNTVLLRLEHLFEVGEATQLSQPVEINIQDLFTTFTITSIEETTLAGNQWLKDANHFEWQPETNDVLAEATANVEPIQLTDNPSVVNVILKPMEIRTFILKLTPKNP